MWGAFMLARRYYPAQDATPLKEHRKRHGFKSPVHAGCALLLSGSCSEHAPPEQPFAVHDVEDEHLCTLVAIEDTARWFNYLPVPPPLQFGWLWPAFRVFSQLLDVAEHSLYELSCRLRIVQCDVISNGIQVS